MTYPQLQTLNMLLINRCYNSILKTNRRTLNPQAYVFYERLNRYNPAIFTWQNARSIKPKQTMKIIFIVYDVKKSLFVLINHMVYRRNNDIARIITMLGDSSGFIGIIKLIPNTINFYIRSENCARACHYGKQEREKFSFHCFQI